MDKTVIIVDDDAMVRKGLERLINWSDYGYELVGKFINGQEAYDFLTKNDVDLVVTDIKMPILNGVELIKKVRKEEIDVEFLVLSGFDDYEYLKEAIKYRVVSYMLKPMNIDDLILNVESVNNVITNKKNKKQVISQGKSALTNSVFQRLLRKSINESELRNKLSILELESITTYSTVCLGMILIENSKDKDRINNVFNIMEDNIVECITNFSDSQQNICIISETEAKLKEYYEKIKNILAYNYKINTYCLGSITVDSIFKLDKAYSSIVENNILKSYPENNIFIDNNTLVLKNNEEDQSLYNIKEIKYNILHNDFESIKNNIKLILFSKYNIANKKQRLYSLFFYIIGVVHENTNSSVNQISIDKFNIIDNLEDLGNFCNKTLDVIENSLKLDDEVDNKYVNDMIRYIRKNYNKGISLKQYAYEINMNPLYLGTLFYEHTNIKFTNYVQKVRVEQACILLKETDYKVSSISKLVGFTNSQYFLRIFNKIIKENPTDYRNNL